MAGGVVLGLSILLFCQVLPGQFSGVPLARNPMSFPRFLLALMALGGIALMLRGTLGIPVFAVPLVDWRRLGLVTLLVALYFAGFGPFGFLPSTALFLPAIMWALGFRNIGIMAAVTALTIVIPWFLFTDVFAIRPPGVGFDTLWRATGGGGG